MTFDNVKNYTRGWVIGDFDPTLVSTTDFEIGVKTYNSGDMEAPHYHKAAKELTIVLTGKMLLNGRELYPDDIVIIERGEVAEFSCIEAGKTLVIKIPSVKSDKYLVEVHQSKNLK